MSWWRVWATLCLLIGLTIVLHSLSHGENIPVRHPLHEFPRKIGTWEGQDVAIDSQTEDLLKASDLLLRVYHSPDLPPVSLFIAYFASQRQGQTVHSPKNCLPGSGWEPVSSDRRGIPVIEQVSVHANRYIVQNGLDRELVYYWYQSHGRTIASEYLAKVDLVLDAIRLNRTDGALVRVALPMGEDETAKDQIGEQFVVMIYPLLRDYIPN